VRREGKTVKGAEVARGRMRKFSDWTFRFSRSGDLTA